MQSGKYHPFLRVLHWLMALLLLSQIFLGWYMEYSEDTMGKDSPAHLALYNLHKSLGIIILILVSARLVTRLTTFVPPFPETISPLMRAAAIATHYTMYALIVIIPLIGYAMSDSLGKGVKFFGMPLPKILPDNQELGESLSTLHNILAYTLLALIVVHVAAVIRHRLFDRPENNVVPRII